MKPIKIFIALSTLTQPMFGMDALKKKQLDIAAAQQSSAELLQGIKTKKSSLKNIPEKEIYGVADDPNVKWRPGAMEDAYHIEIGKDYAFCGLYDGHGGRQVADFAAANLHKNCNLDRVCTKDCVELMKQDLIKGFEKTDKDLDSQSFNSQMQGCTALVAVIKYDHLFIANVGDSRAVLGTKEMKEDARGTMRWRPIAKPLSVDDKAERQDEIDRIVALGGFVTSNRVSGKLALSRALGDKALRPYVIPIPTQTQDIQNIQAIKLTPNDAFLILACDGVWDVITNEVAVAIVDGDLQFNPDYCQQAAEDLKKAALKAGTTDNVTVIVVNLKKFRSAAT